MFLVGSFIILDIYIKLIGNYLKAVFVREVDHAPQPCFCLQLRGAFPDFSGLTL